jgi:anti-sigma factor RsiW
MRQPLPNSELCALLDEEGPTSERERIKAGVAQSRLCAERLALWRRNDAALRFALHGALDGVDPPAPTPEGRPLLRAPPEPMSVGQAQAQRQSHRVDAAALAAFAGGCGAAVVAFTIFILAGG